MLRVARIVAAGEPRHIIQRGDNHQDIFIVDDDRKVHLEFLGDYTGRPLGRDSFRSKLKYMLGRLVRPLPTGHPCSKSKKKKKIPR